MWPQNTHNRELERGPCFEPVGKRQPILVLGDVVGSAFSSEFTQRFKRVSAHSVIAATSMHILNDPTHSSYMGARRAWFRLEAEYSSVCLGLIATTESTVSAACQAVRQGWTDGNMPGALVFLTYNVEILEAWLELSRNRGLDRRAGKRSELPLGSTWPTTMILLPANDPALAACASAIREIRAAGGLVRLEVFGASRDQKASAVRDALIAEMIDEIDAFF